MEGFGYLSKGDVVVVHVEPGEFWWRVFVRGSPHTSLNFTIVGPSGSETIFGVLFGAPPPSFKYEPDPQTGEIPVFVHNITLVSQGGDLESREPIEIGGIVKFSGEYSVRVKQREYWYPEKTVYWPPTPPKQLILYKELHEKEYPYTSLLPIGATLSLSGVVISTWGAKGRKCRTRVKRKRAICRVNKPKTSLFLLPQ